MNLRSSRFRYVAPAPHLADRIAHIVRIRWGGRRAPDFVGWAALGSNTVTLLERGMADGINALLPLLRLLTELSTAESYDMHFGADIGPTALDTDSRISICLRWVWLFSTECPAALFCTVATRLRRCRLPRSIETIKNDKKKNQILLVLMHIFLCIRIDLLEWMLTRFVWLIW